MTSDTDDDDTELVRHKHNFVALEQDTAATPQVPLPTVSNQLEKLEAAKAA